jgi:hypothetical protein
MRRVALLLALAVPFVAAQPIRADEVVTARTQVAYPAGNAIGYARSAQGDFAVLDRLMGIARQQYVGSLPADKAEEIAATLGSLKQALSAVRQDSASDELRLATAKAEQSIADWYTTVAAIVGVESVTATLSELPMPEVLHAMQADIYSQLETIAQLAGQPIAPAI